VSATIGELEPMLGARAPSKGLRPRRRAIRLTARRSVVRLQSLAQQAQNALAQQNSLQQQNLQNAYGQGLLQHQGLGAQALDNNMWCNCVPSRAQVWTAGGDAA
jgi:hypothetical protein